MIGDLLLAEHWAVMHVNDAVEGTKHPLPIDRRLTITNLRGARG